MKQTFTIEEKAHLKMLANRFGQKEEDVLELFKTLQSRHNEVQK